MVPARACSSPHRASPIGPGGAPGGFVDQFAQSTKAYVAAAAKPRDPSPAADHDARPRAGGAGEVTCGWGVVSLAELRAVPPGGLVTLRRALLVHVGELEHACVSEDRTTVDP